MKKFALACIVLLALILRLYQVDIAPRSLLVDEVSIGYIANSILHTGRDEHGVLFPLSFKAFGDNKLPAIIYLTIPFIKLIGFNTLAIKLPSVLAGTLLCIAVYLLIREILKNENVALMASLITAISPWTIILSRFSFESNIGLLIFTTALFCYFRFINSKEIKYLYFSFLLFGLTLYTYISYRLVATLFVILLSVYTYIHFKRLKLKVVKPIILALACFSIVVIPLLPNTLSKNGQSRFSQISVFNNAGYTMRINENRTYCSAYFPKVICYALNNKAAEYSTAIVNNFINNYSPQFLFFQGEQEIRYLSIENFGALPFFVLPLYLLGIIFLITNRSINSNLKYVLVAGLLIAPLPSSLVGYPQRVRLSPLYPFLIILISLGYLHIKKYFSEKIVMISVTVLSVLYSFIFFFYFYTVHVNKYDYAYYGYVPALMKYLYSQKQYDIYMKPFFSEPIIYYAYYNNISPSHYQDAVVLGKPEPNGFQHAEKLDNFNIVSTNPKEIICEHYTNRDAILIVTSDDLYNDTVNKKPLYIAKSKDGVLNYAYVFKGSEIPISWNECKEILSRPH